MPRPSSAVSPFPHCTSSRPLPQVVLTFVQSTEWLCLKRQSSGLVLSVPPAVAGGSAIRLKNHQRYRKLIINPPATAGGTDIWCEAVLSTEWLCLKSQSSGLVLSVPPALAGGSAIQIKNH